MSFPTCNDGVNLLKNLKTDRDKIYMIKNLRRTTHLRRADDKKKACKNVKVDAKTGELGRIRWSEIKYGIFLGCPSQET